MTKKKFDVKQWAMNYINRLMKDEDCVDNRRWARIDNEAQMDAYREQQARGCCGSMDREVTGPDGHRYMIGCNYGH